MKDGGESLCAVERYEMGGVERLCNVVGLYVLGG